MVKTLDAPVYEVKQDSEWFKETVRKREQQREFFKAINEKYFEDNGFSYYHSEHFGVKADSKDYEKYKNELLKNPDKNGIHPFKKRSKFFPVFSEMLKRIEDRDPFKAHDVLGFNNVKASQWVDGRWFFEVKDENRIEGDEVESVNYKDYLKIIMDALGE